MPQNQMFAPSDPYTIESQRIARARKMAELLQQQGTTGIDPNRMAGGWVVPMQKSEGLAKLAQALSGAYMGNKLDEREREAGERQRGERTATMEAFANALKGTPGRDAVEMPPEELGGGPGRGAVAAQPGNPMAAYAELMKSQDPALSQMGMRGMVDSNKPMVLGRSLVTPAGQTLAVDQTWQQEQQATREQRAAEQQATREQRMQEYQLRSQDQRLSQQERLAAQREMQKLQIEARQDMVRLAASLRPPAAPRPPVAVEDEANPGKSVYVSPDQAVGRRPMKATDNSGRLPTSALRLQQEEVDAIGNAASIGTDIAALRSQISEGKLQLGPIRNVVGAAQNYVGLSDESSRNLATLKASLEKLRNDSLKLNKGVQTEGDAQRAWNEVLTNINDPKVVLQRLGEVEQINQRAINLRRANVDMIRSNFGAGPLDTSVQTSQPPVVGSGTDRRETPERRGAAGAPRPGDVIKGYRFKGGNPADKANWEPA